MKKNLFIILLVLPFMLNAQTWSTSSGNIYLNPTTAKVGIGTTSPTQALSVNGKLSIATNAIPDEGYAGSLMLTKPSTGGQFINMIASGKYAWSMGINYNTGNFAISPGKYTDAQFINPLFSISGIGDVSIQGDIKQKNGANIWLGDASDEDQSNRLRIHYFNNAYIDYYPNLEIRAGHNTIVKFDQNSNMRVNGKIHAQEIQVKTNVWADHVFNDGYNLRSLNEVEEFIKTNKHLPDVPSATQVMQEGINVAEMNAILLQKIEELTLLMIEQNKLMIEQNMRIESLEKENQLLK